MALLSIREGALEDLVENGEVKARPRVPGPGSCSLLPEAVPHCLSAITLVRVESDAAPAEKSARVRGVADRSSLGIVSFGGRSRFTTSNLATQPLYPNRSLPLMGQLIPHQFGHYLRESNIAA